MILEFNNSVITVIPLNCGIEIRQAMIRVINVINRIAIHVKLIRYVLICLIFVVYMSENYFKL